jgi:tol-pal system protein YbgF
MGIITIRVVFMRNFFLCFLLFSSISFLSSCALFHPRTDYTINRIEKQLLETNRKIEKVYGSLQTVLAMLNTHEQKIRNLETALENDDMHTLPAPPVMTAIEPIQPLVKKQVQQAKAQDAAQNLYDQAITALNQKHYEKSYNLFNSFVKKYPYHQREKHARSRMAWLAKAIEAGRRQTQTAGRDKSSQTTTNVVEIRNQKSQLAEKMYFRALTAFYHKKYSDALPLFISISQNYPKVDIADNAVYWSGECHYAQNNYYDAILAFKKVSKDYPDGNKAPDALLKTGYSYLALGDLKNARYFLNLVISKYASSPAAIKAEKKLKHLNKGKGSDNITEKSLQVRHDSKQPVQPVFSVAGVNNLIPQ